MIGSLSPGALSSSFSRRVYALSEDVCMPSEDVCMSWLFILKACVCLQGVCMSW